MMRMTAVLIAAVVNTGINTVAEVPSTQPVATIVPGNVGAALDVGRAERISVRSEPPLCNASSPTDCPPPAALSGIADLTEAWSAERMDGRTFVVNNDGPGVLALRAEEVKSDAHWRFGQSRILAAGESAVLTYDGAKGRWQIAGAVVPRLPPPGVAR
jgi:hypothetical protein